MPGILWVCATPLGNLDDASPRLLETLKRVSVVCAEDTRHTLRLFNRFDIHTRLESLHEHTSTAKIDILTRRLVEGEEMALVTDAGTPGVSDPGPALVRSATTAGVEVRPIPGPCALVAALSVSGFDAQRFSFVGFLPRKPGKIRKLFESYCAREETFVFYESPFRVGKTLRFLAEVAPDARVAACRELTKQFEEIVRGSAIQVSENFGARKEIKGEFCVVVSPSVGTKSDEEEDEE
ncbi:ribosomal RNA small subunit methyltransferase I [Abditibacteriota bacterium]|nr:ribosomal RNA small subunit methyltransferase I [Abditibacteriota bacterium]